MSSRRNRGPVGSLGAASVSSDASILRPEAAGVCIASAPYQKERTPLTTASAARGSLLELSRNCLAYQWFSLDKAANADETPDDRMDRTRAALGRRAGLFRCDG